MNKLSVESNIASELKRRILDGEYKLGSVMPTQSQLTKEFKTSFTTITKALNQVKEHGLIELSPKRGTRVLPLNKRPTKGLVGIIILTWYASEPTQCEPKLMIDGICKKLTENNQHYELVYMLQPENKNRNLLKELNRYVGFIFIEMFKSSSLVAELEQRRFPYVVANLEVNSEFTSTWVDHKKTTATAVSVLAAFGHKHIALLTKELDSYFYRSALKGYKQGLKNAKIKFDEKLVIITKEKGHAEVAYTATKHYLDNHSTPTAIIACRDYLAAGVWQAITERGLNIGTDVSIIGFDNLSWPEGKNLTTFNEPAMELGTVAAEMILDRITYGFKPIEKRELEAPLILSSSVGPCQESNANSIPLKLYKTA
jgi:GntR family transcriptional regulator, arabinose operon transcriptional repressor